MIIVEVNYQFESGRREAFCQAVIQEGILTATREEKGNLRYELFYPAQTPDSLLLLERWEDEAALERHFATPHFQRMIALEKELSQDAQFQRFAVD